MMRIIIVPFSLVIYLTIGIVTIAQPQSSARERQKIEALIKYIGSMNDAKFVRNGTPYDSKTAATFLRRKLEANESQVKTAHDFIEKIASFSSTSGKPYVIRFNDGEEANSRDVLLTALRKIEKG
jgi:Family of unknown function (DUF5329)